MTERNIKFTQRAQAKFRLNSNELRNEVRRKSITGRGRKSLRDDISVENTFSSSIKSRRDDMSVIRRLSSQSSHLPTYHPSGICRNRYVVPTGFNKRPIWFSTDVSSFRDSMELGDVFYTDTPSPQDSTANEYSRNSVIALFSCDTKRIFANASSTESMTDAIVLGGHNDNKPSSLATPNLRLRGVQRRSNLFFGKIVTIKPLQKGVS
jgi:hypothetical protein